MASGSGLMSHAEMSTKERKELAEEDEALPNGSFPIRNREDLHKAVEAIGRAANRELTQAWILKRAKELHAEETLPEWLKNPKSTAENPNGDELEHHGIKGQKWGVRRTPEQLSKKDKGGRDNPNLKGLSKRDQRTYTKKGYEGLLMRRKDVLLTMDANLKALNKKYKKLGKQASNEYYQELGDTFAYILDSKLNRKKGAEVRLVFTQGSLGKPAVYLNNSDPLRNLNIALAMSSKNKKRSSVRHAEDEVETIEIEVNFDEDGFVTDFELSEDIDDLLEEEGDDEMESEDEMAHIDSEFVIDEFLHRFGEESLDGMSTDEFIEHHGIKGMKWGVRRTPEQLGHKKTGSTRERKPNHSARAMRKNMREMSDDDIRKLMNRIKLESDYNALVRSSQTKAGSVYTKQWAKQFSQKTLEQIVGGLISGGANKAGQALTQYWLQKQFGIVIENKKK